MIYSSDSLHLLPCHFNDPSRGWPALRLAPISPCLLPVVAFSNFMHTHTFVTNSHTYIGISSLSESLLVGGQAGTLIQGSPIRMKTSKVSNKMTQLLAKHHLRPHLVRNLKCMLYTLFRLHIASGSEKIKSIHMCLKNMYWLGQQCDSSGYRYTLHVESICNIYYFICTLLCHISDRDFCERSQSLEVRPWRLEVWQLQNIFGSRGF